MRDQFPLVGDDEVIITDSPVMNLYDDRDLISNIQGPYHHPIFEGERLGTSPSYQSSSSHRQVADNPFDGNRKLIDGGRDSTQRLGESCLERSRLEQPLSYHQRARLEAKADLKRKRSATYLNFDKIGFKSKELPIPKSRKKDLEKEQIEGLSLAADRLRQKAYILADIKPKPEPKMLVEADPQKSVKNTYDFLKTSQVYNYQGKGQKKEKKVTQELNLAHVKP